MQPLSPSDRALGDLLVDRQVLTLPQLDEATALAEKWHVRLGDAIRSRNWIEPADYYRAVAYHYDLPFVDLIHEPPDPALLTRRRCRHLRVDADDAVARRDDGPPGDRHRRARARDRAVRAPALGHADRVRGGLEVRRVLGGAERPSTRRCRAARCSSSPSATRRCRRSQVFSPAQVVIGFGLLTAVAGGACASRRSAR